MMGKDKGMKLPKDKKKNKDKHSMIVIPPKSNAPYCSDSEESEPDVFTKKAKKSNESPKKKAQSCLESTPLTIPGNKSKKNKEVIDFPFAKKKSKKDKETKHTIFEKSLIKSSPSKKSKLNVIAEEENIHSDLSDNEGSLPEKGDVREAVNPTDNGIITSDKHIVDETGWLKEDFVTLLENMAKFIPDKDHLKYTSRVERLDWSQIKFNDHTADECKEKWKLVEKKVRGFRILKEMVDDAKLWLDKPWSSFYNSNKKNRHPDMPRRPLTSYMLFYMAKKNKFSKKHPNLGLTDLSKIIADKFHKLSESKKQKYVDEARLLREQFNEKMQIFIDTHPNESMSIKKKLKEEKTQMPGPKRPLPPVKLFIEERLKHIDKNDCMSKAEVISQIKEGWKHLSNKKKVPWIRWAHENEKKYLEELEIYKSENPQFVMPKIKPLLSKEEVTILERMEGKPEKPPNSAYSLFSRLMLKDDQMKLMNFSPKERMKEISRLWAAVSDEEKKQYQEKAKHLLEIYKLEYATYLESLPEDKRAEELAKSQGRKRKKKETIEFDSNGRKLKQLKLGDSFKKKELITSSNIKNKDLSSEEEEEESADDDEPVSEEEDILNQPQKVREIKSKLDSQEPPKPSLNAFELFKKIYLTNPGNKESKALMVWESIPKKEKERYRKKLEAQKQNYILKYKEFLANLKPHEIKVYSLLKNQSSAHLSDSSDGEESDDEKSQDSSDNGLSKAIITSVHKTEDTSSSSEDSD